MTSGSSLDTFADFQLATGSAIYSGPEEIINELVKNTYLLARFMAGKEPADMLQGGANIKDDIFLDERSTFRNYKPNPELTYSNPQVLSQWTVDWRFGVDEMVTSEHEIELNTGGLTEGGRHHQFKRLARSKEMRMWTSMMNGIEDNLTATPSGDNMEAADGRVPFSLGALIREESTGLAPSNWSQSTVMGIDPAVKTKWNNQRATYAGGDYSVKTILNNWDGFQAMSRLYHQTQFDRLPKYNEYSEPKSNPTLIATDLNGITLYEDALRQNQDTFVSSNRQDPSYPMPLYRGIDVVYVSNLDGAALYDDGASGYAAAHAADITGPRFYFLNGKYIKFICHSNRYFEKSNPITPSRQPFTRIIVCDLWYNLITTSRRRHAILSPAADVTGAYITAPAA